MTEVLHARVRQHLKSNQTTRAKQQAKYYEITQQTSKVKRLPDGNVTQTVMQIIKTVLHSTDIFPVKCFDTQIIMIFKSNDIHEAQCFTAPLTVDVIQ
jgi:hypothetical protein